MLFKKYHFITKSRHINHSSSEFSGRKWNPRFLTILINLVKDLSWYLFKEILKFDKCNIYQQTTFPKYQFKGKYFFFIYPVWNSTFSLTYSLIHSLINSLTHSLTYSLTHSPTIVFICLRQPETYYWSIIIKSIIQGKNYYTRFNSQLSNYLQLEFTLR